MYSCQFSHMHAYTLCIAIVVSYNNYGMFNANIVGNDGCCNSVTFSTYGVIYSSVCWHVRGYQYQCGISYVIQSWWTSSIHGTYVNEVSITHGSPIYYWSI